MKTFFKATMIVVFLLLCSNGIQAQTPQTKLNQVELMKQGIGYWKCESKDTTFVIEDKYYGGGHEVYIKSETKGKIIWEGKTLVGYDKKNDILIESVIIHNSPDIALYLMRFISANKFEEMSLENISNPEQATEKWTYEFKSPNLLIATHILNNKLVYVRNYSRVKQ
ncbi:MAG: hypothetical protein ABSA76_10155 [Bacteroidales bacterium]